MGKVELPVLMTPKEVAEFLQIKEQTLLVWRHYKRYNLPYVKIGRRVFYKEKDVKDFLDARTIKYTERKHTDKHEKKGLALEKEIDKLWS
jgi:excisionase family DNA binding protein